MTILAVRGGEKNSVIDKNPVVKKWKFENFDQNSCYIPQKKLRTCRIQIQVEEVEFVTEKRKKIFLISFFQRGDPLMSER